jgi:uncharacterized protein (DUF433 family)
MDWRERIVADPEILLGKPTIKGTRIAAELILERLAHGWSEATIIEAYPRLTTDDIRAVLLFAAEMLGEDRYLAASKAAA